MAAVDEPTLDRFKAIAHQNCPGPYRDDFVSEMVVAFVAAQGSDADKTAAWHEQHAKNRAQNWLEREQRYASEEEAVGGMADVEAVAIAGGGHIDYDAPDLAADLHETGVCFCRPSGVPTRSVHDGAQCEKCCRWVDWPYYGKAGATPTGDAGPQYRGVREGVAPTSPTIGLARCDGESWHPLEAWWLRQTVKCPVCGRRAAVRLKREHHCTWCGERMPIGAGT